MRERRRMPLVLSSQPARKTTDLLPKRKKRTNQRRTEVRGHLGSMREPSLTLTFLYSSYSNKIPIILPLHLQFIESSSDGQRISFMAGGGWERASLSSERNNLCFWTTSFNTDKKGLSSSCKCIHFKLESVSSSKLTQLDQNWVSLGSCTLTRSRC